MLYSEMFIAQSLIEDWKEEARKTVSLETLKINAPVIMHRILWHDRIKKASTN